jgi:hypothetical protein
MCALLRPIRIAYLEWPAAHGAVRHTRAGQAETRRAGACWAWARGIEADVTRQARGAGPARAISTLRRREARGGDRAARGWQLVSRPSASEVGYVRRFVAVARALAAWLAAAAAIFHERAGVKSKRGPANQSCGIREGDKSWTCFRAAFLPRLGSLLRRRPALAWPQARRPVRCARIGGARDLARFWPRLAARVVFRGQPEPPGTNPCCEAIEPCGMFLRAGGA